MNDKKEISKEHAELIFKGLFSETFGEIRAIFRRANLAPIEDLESEKPTYTQLAQSLKEIYKLMVFVNDEYLKLEQHDLSHLGDCIDLISSLGKSIDLTDHDGICESLAKLAEKPYI